MQEERKGKMIWLDDEVCEELETAVKQGVMGDSVNEVLRVMLRLPRGVFKHPVSRHRGSRGWQPKD